MFKDSPKLKSVFLVGFLFALQSAFTAYINSTFLSSFVSEKLVGLSYALGSITAILALFMAPKIFGKIGGYKFLLSIATFNALCIFLLTLAKSAWSAVPI